MIRGDLTTQSDSDGPSGDGVADQPARTDLTQDAVRSVVTTLRDLFERGGQRREQIEASRDKDLRAAERRHDERASEAAAKAQADRAAVESEHGAEVERITSEADAEIADCKRKFGGERGAIADKHDEALAVLSKSMKEGVWLAETMYEANEAKPEEAYERIRQRLKVQRERVGKIEWEAEQLVANYRQRSLLRAPPPETASPPEGPDAQAALDGAIEEAEALLRRLDRQRVARLFQEATPYVLVLALIGAGAALASWRTGWTLNVWVGVAAGGAAVVAIGGGALLYMLARSRVRAVFQPLRLALSGAKVAAQAALEHAMAERKRAERELVETRDAEIAQAKAKYSPRVEQIKRQRAERIAQVESARDKRLGEVEARRDADLRAENERYASSRAQIEERIGREESEIESERAAATESIRQRYEAQWAELGRDWRDRIAWAWESIEAMHDLRARLFPAWDEPGWSQRPPADRPPDGVQFGSLDLNLAALPGGLPDDPRLPVPMPKKVELPALIDFPAACSVLIEAEPAVRDAAIGTLQATMLRLLTTFPPGKVRFTIVDPIGLGENFAGFMHLADHDESLVADRIWTESRHIERRLSDLTEHMENVIQKYLRNEFETITAYNEQAGEVAEPYRFLVIADFPANFTEAAARRLASILNSGPRCGVYVLMARDPGQRLPGGIGPTDLDRFGTRVEHRKGRFVQKDSDLGSLPLTLEPRPPESFLTETLQRIGRQAKESSRVEVSYSLVAPGPGQIWSGDCARELSVPIGRAGATKLQYLSLGQGTLQHVLIAGKTGSGKSTLLHVLITNLASWFSPDQVQFYLVDFKKGVEFKTYGTHALPHARAIAVESDREFGLSVLQEVDAELKRRGDLFRSLGVQGMAAYRALEGVEPLPRTLLIIDEFQELFVEDDKVAQESALLLDRLVRQGRAFGIHVILGSQTLGGAYTLARTTMGQMGVRIALQCSEADSYLILSEDNAGARLLSRPGEGIYNDASGQLEGNNPFQVVWLPESTREAQLSRIADLAKQQGWAPPRDQIVFEGNAPADIRRNRPLADLLALNAPPPPQPSVSAWLGEAIAIKDPTAAVFRRHSGSNLLMVGQREESAAALVTASVVGLAAQHATEPRGDGTDAGAPGAVFYILDGTPPDSPSAGFASALASSLPHDARVVEPGRVAEALAEIDKMLSERRDSPHRARTNVFVFVHGLHWLRALRRREDDFGFSMSESDETPRPDRQFADLLTDGPGLGIHTVVWCDTLQNVNRALDRQSLRNFDTRALFQMSASDSIELIDSPQASKLGLQRALLHHEEHGHAEKFRPYAMPDRAWVREVGELLRTRDRTAG